MERLSNGLAVEVAGEIKLLKTLASTADISTEQKSSHLGTLAASSTNFGEYV